jgi:hypothetical protein
MEAQEDGANSQEPSKEPLSHQQYAYPDLTPGADGVGGKYWHKLSDTSEEALHVVQAWVAESSTNLLELGTNDLHSDLLLLRYLRANGFNTKKTIAHIQKNIEWRKTMDIAAIVEQRPEDILGCSLEELTAVFPHWHSGYDKTGRPVLFKQYGSFEAGLIKKLVNGDFNNVVRYHIWEQEACGRLCLAKSKADKAIVETISAVIDIKGMGMSQITRDFLNLTKMLAEIDQNQYPETMGKAFIINAPAAFPLVWRMVKPWLDPVTVAKIQIFGGPKEFIPALVDFIGAENLPENYGGVLPPLSPQVHPYAETMASYPEKQANIALIGEDESKDSELDEDEVTRRVAYPYPDSTPGSVDTTGRYWLKLSEDSQTALTAVQRWIDSDRINLQALGTNDLHSSLLLIRYLRANNFNAKKTIAHIQKNIEWRKTMDIAAIVKQRPEDILGCSLEELTAVFPHWHSGYDKTGRPVLFKQYGNFEAGLIKKLVGGSFDNVVRYHIWEQEACARLCFAKSQQNKAIVETITAVIDIKGMGMSQITRDFLSLTKSIAEIDQNQYPETLGKAFIINAPAAFPLVWRMVKPWLDPATVAKIQIFGGPKEYIPALQEYIGEENLPSNYGGTLPPLSPQVHPYAETMKTYNKTETDLANAQAASAYNRISKRDSLRRKKLDTVAAARANPDAEQATKWWFLPSTLFASIQNDWFLGGSPLDDNESDWGDNKSVGSADLDFADAFECQSDLETNSHTHTYSMNPDGSGTTGLLREKSDKAKRPNFCSRMLTRFTGRLLCDRPIRKMSLRRLELYLAMCVFVHLLVSVAAACISGIALAAITWSSTGTRVQLWAFTVALLISCYMIIFDFVGYYGIQVRNWVLLIMYEACVFVGTILYFVISIACFVYYSIPNITGVSDGSLNSTLSSNRAFILVLAVGSLIGFLFGILPLVLTRGWINKLREHAGKKYQTKHVQTTLKFAQSISIAGGIVMLFYGGFGLEYLLNIRFGAPLFPVYGLVYGGVSVLISSTIGLWAANTVHRSVLRLYVYFILPFIILLLLSVALINFGNLSDIERKVTHSYPSLATNESEEKIKANVETYLLVAGSLSIFLSVFQSISLAATRMLTQNIDSSIQVKEKFAILQAMKEKELGIYSSGGIGENGEESAMKDTYWANFSVEHLGRLYMLYSRNQKDRLVILWGVLMGLWNIFVNGTLAVFARNANESSINSSFVFALPKLLGRGDNRFIHANAYLCSSETLLAIFFGPCLLIYAWSTFVYAPYR